MARSVDKRVIVLAALALALAFGGTALAGGLPLGKAIDGRQVKPGTEPGNRLIANSVTGKEVKESSLKRVAKAKGATRADVATTAVHADNATSAATATTVGGRTAASLQVACPAGTTASGGTCIETGAARAAATWANAIATCTAAGGRTLPTPAQLEHFRLTAGVVGSELTGDLFDSADAYVVDMATGNTTVVSFATATPFHCATPPTN